MKIEKGTAFESKSGWKGRVTAITPNGEACIGTFGTFNLTFVPLTQLQQLLDTGEMWFLPDCERSEQ